MIQDPDQYNRVRHRVRRIPCLEPEPAIRVVLYMIARCALVMLRDLSGREDAAALAYRLADEVATEGEMK